MSLLVSHDLALWDGLLLAAVLPSRPAGCDPMRMPLPGLGLARSAARGAWGKCCAVEGIDAPTKKCAEFLCASARLSLG